MNPTAREAIAYVQRRVTTRTLHPATARRYRYVLFGFATAMGDRPIDKIGRSDIERWMGTIGHLAPGTRRHHFTIVRTFFDDLVERGKVKRSPVRPMPAPKVPRSPHRALTAEQTAAILAHAPDQLARCYIILGLQCGLRRAEMAGIEIGDINWSAPSVTVIGKGGHSRTVPLPREAVAIIEEYLAVRPGGGGPLLRQRQNPASGVTPVWIGQDFTAIAYAAGVKRRARDGVSLHATRHTAATDCYQASKDVTAVRDMLGHASLSTTQTYVKGMDISGMARAMEGRTYRTGDAA